MNLRQYIITMILGTLLCWGSWVMVLFNVDPFASELSGFLLFYVSLFLAMLGTVSLIVTLIYHFANGKHTPMFVHVQRGFRDAAIVCILLIGLLVLQGKGWLTLLNSAVLFVSLLLIGAIKLTTNRPPGPPTHAEFE